MSAEQLSAMDIYSTPMISFAVAGWCRGHKFSPLAVDLAKRLRAYHDIQKQIDALEKQHAALYGDIKTSVRLIEEADAKETLPPVPKPYQPKLTRVKAAAA